MADTAPELVAARGNLLDEIEAAADLLQATDRRLDQLITEALRVHCTHADIACCLGISRQGVLKRINRRKLRPADEETRP